jgi:hypothetical protein
MCGCPVFVRSAGMRQSLPSTSAQVASRTSPLRAAVSATSRKASAQSSPRPRDASTRAV